MGFKLKRALKSATSHVRKEAGRVAKKSRAEARRVAKKTRAEHSRVAKRVKAELLRSERKVSVELGRAEKKSGFPIKALLGAIFPAYLPGLVAWLEEVVKRGSKRYVLTQATKNIIERFKKETNFKLKPGYRNIEFFYNAHVPGGNAGITFENRVYFAFPPYQKDADDLGLIFHEIVHTYQYRKQGLTIFIAKYLADYMKNLIQGKGTKGSYYKVSYENEAYRYEDQFVDWLRAQNLPK